LAFDWVSLGLRAYNLTMQVVAFFQADFKQEKDQNAGKAIQTADSTQEMEAERQRLEEKKADVANDSDDELRARARKLHNKQPAGSNPE